MNYRIVSDSSANVLEIDGIDLGVVPLHVIVGEEDFVDDAGLDLANMQEALSSYKGKTSTACPGPQDWMQAFGNADAVFCVTITSKLSGACASAKIAKDIYESEDDGKKVYVIDSLTTGPEMVLIIEKLKELMEQNLSPEEAYAQVMKYMKKTHLYFSLGSVDNLAKNGRVNPLLAKGINLLGIKLVGRASDEGTLESLDKCRGEKKAYKKIVDYMKSHGYTNGKLVIAHNNNKAGASALLDMIKNEFGEVKAMVHNTRALCSYYAEPDSILVGFEA